ncbi:MAG TPA: hypothetical protein VMS56_02520 [Thermoanaerobaculia bacterium]|nr:hypothetical protein [Thermoanaerobaculia bacterium]
MRVEYLENCRVPTCSNSPIGPGATAEVFPTPVSAQNPGPGVFLYVHQGESELLRFNLRTQDVSRQHLTFGTELPVIRDDEVFTTSLNLFPVPTDGGFRQTLRIYDFDANPTSQIRVRIYDTQFGPSAAGNLLVEEIVTLASPTPNGPDPERPDRPGFGQRLDLVDLYPVLAGSQYVRIEIEPMTSGLRFWAFVSVTNNETQHVTTITPN